MIAQVLSNERLWHVETCDVLDGLRSLPDGCVQCVCTSPPYFALRDYQIAGQIGLEETPDTYIAKMVEVFAEVRRVLRSDGTCFINIGDSYASSPAGNKTFNHGAIFNGRDMSGHQSSGKLDKTRFSNIKPKDLLGIPWLLAFALRAPHFGGRIKDIHDRIWLAAMIDAEGCFYIHKRKAGLHAGDGYYRKNDTYSLGIEVSNTHAAIVEKCAAIAGCGSTSVQEAGRRQPLYRWHVRCDEAKQLCRELYPHLVAKHQQCRLAYGTPPNGEQAERAHESLMALHHGGVATIDFPAPASCFSPGWYLRSEIVWAKPNPMPESVTDRPTKAHEQVFLLAKSSRYFYDAEAIKEDAIHAGAFVRTNGDDGMDAGYDGHRTRDGLRRGVIVGDGRNRRSVWTMSTKPFSEAHFATFPPDLPETCLKAGTSAKGCCSVCGAPWERVTESERVPTRPGDGSKVHGANSRVNKSRDPAHASEYEGKKHSSRLTGGAYAPPGQSPYSTARALEIGNRDPQRHVTQTKTTGWQPGCNCGGELWPCLVCDPFSGAGTTGLVAAKGLGLRYIGFELNPDYADMSRRRIEKGFVEPTPKVESAVGQLELFD